MIPTKSFEVGDERSGEEEKIEIPERKVGDCRLATGSNLGAGTAGSNLGTGVIGSNPGTVAAGSNFGFGAAGSNLGTGAAVSNLRTGVRGSNLGPRAAVSNFGTGAAVSNLETVATGSNLGSGAAGSNLRSGAAGSNLGSGAAGSDLARRVGVIAAVDLGVKIFKGKLGVRFDPETVQGDERTGDTENLPNLPTRSGCQPTFFIEPREGVFYSLEKEEEEGKMGFYLSWKNIKNNFYFVDHIFK